MKASLHHMSVLAGMSYKSGRSMHGSRLFSIEGTISRVDCGAYRVVKVKMLTSIATFDRFAAISSSRMHIDGHFNVTGEDCGEYISMSEVYAYLDAVKEEAELLKIVTPTGNGKVKSL